MPSLLKWTSDVTSSTDDIITGKNWLCLNNLLKDIPEQKIKGKQTNKMLA